MPFLNLMIVFDNVLEVWRIQLQLPSPYGRWNCFFFAGFIRSGSSMIRRGAAGSALMDTTGAAASRSRTLSTLEACLLTTMVDPFLLTRQLVFIFMQSKHMSTGIEHTCMSNRAQSLTGGILPCLELTTLSKLSDGRKSRDFRHLFVL